MKILHTSDLHLGKRLEGFLRMEEQSDCLNEITRMALEKSVDAVLIAGDIFDTKYPVAKAEELFYSFCLSLSLKGIALVAISGNHDDALRFSAARGLGRMAGCFFIGSNDLSDLSCAFNGLKITGGECGLKIEKGNERLNILTLPFFNRAVLSEMGYDSENYEDNLSALIRKGEWVFSDEENAFNIFMGHIFLAGSILTGDEAELGLLAQVSSNILPTCHYSALGHIHKKGCVSKSKNAYYSGSILQYKFDESPIKGCYIAERKNCETIVSFAPFSVGKKLVKVTASTLAEALLILDENESAFVEIEYSGTPLLLSELKELRGRKNLIKLTNVFKESDSAIRQSRCSLSDTELFEAFFFEKTGKKPSNEEIELFLRVLSEKEIQGEKEDEKCDR